MPAPEPVPNPEAASAVGTDDDGANGRAQKAEPKRMSLAQMRTMKQDKQARIQRTISEPSFPSRNGDDIGSRDSLSEDAKRPRKVHFLDEVAPVGAAAGAGDSSSAATSDADADTGQPSETQLGRLLNRRGLRRLRRTGASQSVDEQAMSPARLAAPTPLEFATPSSPASPVSECRHSFDDIPAGCAAHDRSTALFCRAYMDRETGEC